MKRLPHQQGIVTAFEETLLPGRENRDLKQLLSEFESVPRPDEPRRNPRHQ